MREAELEEVEEYVLGRQDMVAHYIAEKPIMNLCEEVVQRLGTWVPKSWWKQEGLDPEGERAEAEAEDEGYSEKAEEDTERVAGN